MQREEMIDLVKGMSGASEMYHVTTFRGYRERRIVGSMQEITVEVWDEGTSKPALRYSVRVRDTEGREALGTPQSTVDAALRHVHWDQLD